MPGKICTYQHSLAITTQVPSPCRYQDTSPIPSTPFSPPMAYVPRSATVLSMNDDAIPALHAVDDGNHILLLTPTTPQTHDYHYGALIHYIRDRYGKSVHAMDYNPPPTSNPYLCFDARHLRALDLEGCAGVIVVIDAADAELARTRSSQFDFAIEVWNQIGGGVELPAVLVELGGAKRGVGDWGTVLWAKDRRWETLEEVATSIFVGR